MTQATVGPATLAARRPELINADRTAWLRRALGKAPGTIAQLIHAEREER